jgi:hypothetical protein
LSFDTPRCVVISASSLVRRSRCAIRQRGKCGRTTWIASGARPIRRFCGWWFSPRFADIQEGKTVDGGKADQEAEPLNKQDEIEYLLGLDEFETGETS